MALFTSLPAYAQSTTSDTDQSDSQATSTSTLGDIVVTARRRAESVMNIPVVATTLNEEVLNDKAVTDIVALTTRVPALTSGNSVLSVGTQVSIRGVGTSVLDPGVEASAALNIDGMGLSQGLAYASGLFDLGQVDVLKGPQSLFFGKSAPAGVIAIRTADPGTNREIIVRGGYEFEARERRGDFIISGPVSDTLALRLAATYGEQDGYFKNNAVGIISQGSRDPAKRRITPGDDYVLRATAIWRPSDRFDARIKLNRVHNYALYAGSGQPVLCPDGTGPVFGRQYMNPDCTLDRNMPLVDLDPAAFPGIPNNGTPYNETDQTFGTVELNYRLTPELTVTSATAYYDVVADSLLNAAATSAAAGLYSATNHFKRSQFNQEFRLVSDFSGPLNFTAGAFIERGEFSNLAFIGGNLTLGVPAVLQKGYKHVDVETNSLFAQLLYQLTDKLEVTGGVRWTDETRTQDGLNMVTGSSVPVVFPVPEISSSNYAPEVTFTYRATEDFTVFGALKKGYKSGSFNVGTAPFTGENNAFNDEMVEGGELGLKARLWNRTAMLNVAAYFYDYSGLQVGASTQNSNGTYTTRTVNAGSAEVKGIEADFTYYPPQVAGLSLYVAANWNDAKYTKLEHVPCYGGQMISEGCNSQYSATANSGAGGFTGQDRSGTPMIRAPEWTANFGFDFAFPLNGTWELALSNGNKYSSEYVTNIGFLYYQPSFFTSDLGVIFKSPRWDFGVVGKNVGDVLTTGNCANSNRQSGAVGGQSTGTNIRGAAGVDEVGCYLNRGREVWLRATARF